MMQNPSTAVGDDLDEHAVQAQVVLAVKPHQVAEAVRPVEARLGWD